MFNLFLAFDRKDSELSPEELQDKHIAKRKMLGNIKFIGMAVFQNSPQCILEKKESE